MESFSQHGQDIYVYDNLFKEQEESGIFVDVGAYDGERYSNSLFFEKYLQWRGLCIEPLPGAYAQLKARRTSPCVNCAISDFDGRAEFMDVDVGIAGGMFSGLSASG